MALRPVSTLGLADATDLAPASALGAQDAPAVAVASAPPQRRASRRSPRASRSPLEGARAIASVGALSDEPTTFVQIMVAGELQERLADVSHLLAAEHRKLRHQKTILGALVWRYVDPDDPQRLQELGETLDAYFATDLAEVPAEVKIGAHLPFSLKYRLDGAALALRRTRRDASAKTLLSALVWAHVERDGLPQLLSMLAAYRDALQPTPTSLYELAADAGSGLESPAAIVGG